MQHTMSRTLLVAVSSAGLVLGGAVSAGASDKDHKDNGKGWVKVCQEIKDKKKDDKDWKKNHDDYEGTYKVKDSKGKVYKFDLEGKDDCKKVKVNKGWTRVTVKEQPEDTKLKSDKNQWVKVKEGKTKEVTFTYKVEKDDKD